MEVNSAVHLTWCPMLVNLMGAQINALQCTECDVNKDGDSFCDQSGYLAEDCSMFGVPPNLDSNLTPPACGSNGGKGVCVTRMKGSGGLNLLSRGCTVLPKGHEVGHCYSVTVQNPDLTVPREQFHCYCDKPSCKYFGGSVKGLGELPCYDCSLNGCVSGLGSHTICGDWDTHKVNIPTNRRVFRGCKMTRYASGTCHEKENNTICYCNDKHYCNASGGLAISNVAVLITLMLTLHSARR